MALTAQVKDELARLTVTKPCCRKAEVSALLRFAGGLHIVSGRVLIEAELDTSAAARRLRHDIHEVFGGGLHFSRCGWETQLGPGRHPISSAYFWYFKNPAGGLIEYYADEDQLTADWQPREFEPGPTVFAEWAVDGGLDGHTRRQKGAQADGKFLTEKK